MLTSSDNGPPKDLVSPMDLVTRLLVMTSDTLHSVRTGSLASLILSLIGSLFFAISSALAIFFPHSPLLAYSNIFWPLLASTFAFVAAAMLSVLVVGVFAAVNGAVHVAGVKIGQGGSVLLLAWLAWVLVLLALVYWGLVWFVEVRRWSFTKRRRSEDEVGNWKGIGTEVWKDLRKDKTALYVHSIHA